MAVTNEEISELFEDMASLLEMKGDVIFKIRAYQRAARTISQLPQSLELAVRQEQELKKIPGIVEKIVESIKDTKFDRAHFKSFGDFSLDIEIVYYVFSSDYNKYMDSQQKINWAIKEQFEKEGIEFAYPTQTLFMSKISS